MENNELHPRIDVRRKGIYLPGFLHFGTIEWFTDNRDIDVAVVPRFTTRHGPEKQYTPNGKGGGMISDQIFYLPRNLQTVVGGGSTHDKNMERK